MEDATLSQTTEEQQDQVSARGREVQWQLGVEERTGGGKDQAGKKGSRPDVDASGMQQCRSREK